MRQASVVRLRAFSPWGSGTRHISAGLENDRIIPSLGEGGQPAGGITEGGIQIHDPAQPLYGTGLVPDLLQEQRESIQDTRRRSFLVSGVCFGSSEDLDRLRFPIGTLEALPHDFPHAHGILLAR